MLFTKTLRISSLLYGVEIIVYLDETVATGSMQQNLKSLIQKNMVP